VILVFIALMVFLATLLFRNALIVLLVILSPLAFLAFVLPGTDKYWKYWKDNFVKLLVFFPLAMSIIYAGRIFAWTVGNLGKPGPLDAIMVLAGFFGPYFFLPKAFKWGGTLLATANKGLNESWPVKKSREVSTKGLQGRQQRKLNEFAKSLDPSRDGYVRRRPGKRFGLIPNYEGSLAKTALWNVRAGRLIPTKRGLASAIQRGETWSSEEDAIAAAKIKREKDKAAAEDPNSKKEHPTYSYRAVDTGKRDEKGRPIYAVKGEVSTDATARGKAAYFNAAGREDEREAGVAIEGALKTSSWVEIFKNLVPVIDDSKENPNGLAARIRKSGAEKFEGDPDNPATAGKLFVRMYDLPRYISKVNSAEDLYPLPLGKGLLATPHITNPENPKIRDNVRNSLQDERQAAAQAQENERANKEGRAPVKVDPVAPEPALTHEAARAIDAIRGYMDAGNISGQSEAEFNEFERLARAEPRIAIEFGKLLERIAGGGQGGINVLTQLNSSASMQNSLNELLAHAPEGTPEHTTIQALLKEGQESITGRPASPAADTAPAGAGDQEQATSGDNQQRRSSGTTAPGGAYTPSGRSTASGGVTFRPNTSQPGYQAPGELKIDHRKLADTIMEATREGAKLGVSQAFREPGAHKPGDVFRPDREKDDDDK
jgi:hypothetical protein